MTQLYCCFKRTYFLLVSLLLWLGAAVPAAAQTYQVPAAGTLAFTTCGGVLYDNGGPNGMYSPNANGSVTLTPATPGNKIRLQFTLFSLEQGYDYLYIYDGLDATAPLIGIYDSQNPGTVYATNSAGALTVRFTSDNSWELSGFAADIACVTTVPQADLAIQGASAQPLAVVAGNQLSVNCTVYNLSGTLAQSSTVGYYLSTDATLSQNDQLLGSSTGGPLASNQSAYRASSLTLPAATPTGSYYLLFAADHQNVVNESNEANNVASISINVVPSMVDLLIQQASVATPNTAPGNVLALSCYVANQGNATAQNSSVGFYLSADAVLDANDQLLTSVFGGQLTPTYNQYRAVSTNVPAGTAPGSYYVLFVADYQSIVQESNEANNTAAVPIVVAPPSLDLVVQQAQLNQSTVAAGATLSSTAYVVNQGNTTAQSSSLGIYLSTDATLSTNDQLLTAVTVPQLLGNQGASLYPQIPLPGTVAPGSYHVLFVADYQNTVGETNEANNVRSQPLTVLAPSVDLLMQQVFVNPATTVAGASVSVSSYVYNLGNSSAASSTVGYYLSTDNVLSANDILVGSTFGGSLAGGGSTTRFGTLTIPASLATGTYYVFSVVDYQNQVSETNEANNAASASLTLVAPGVDLSVSQPGLYRNSVGAGAQLAAYVTVHNQGNIATSSSSVGFYLSADATLSTNDVLLNGAFGGYLAAGTSSQRTTSFTVPAGTAPGLYYVLFVADYQNAVAETNETNNLASVTLTVTAPFNGTVVPFSGTASITTCGTTVYDHAGTDEYDDYASGTLVINPGTPGSQVQLIFSLLEVESCCDALIIYNGSSTAAPVLGRYTRNPGVVTASNGSGALTLQFVSDGSVTYDGFQATVSCVTGSTTLPDLLIRQATLSTATALRGSIVTASCELLNQGAVAAGQSATGYYLSTDAVFSPDDVLLGNSQAGSLTSGFWQAQAATLIIPPTTPAGNYHVLFVADYVGNLAESNENNNVAARSLAVTIVQGTHDDQLAGLSLRVFPNPTAGSQHLTVQLDGAGNGKAADLRLYDALGREVAQQQLTLGPRRSTATFDATRLSRGIYVLRLTGEGLNATRRVVVE
ncbi:CARDB domain-containing protein [Hymenobacter weizhouensis]|uniref:CARDB domain-containing protein n=1 Tax=Hymenobacter sp. YIM 151500-1 TaxID=2987689 RepID=UPI002227D6B3|nr:CARDB domain-containing protein [Hymenobacter sp. YIM 151500-1]UYZ62914.1 T9SS type A sorting domain-containing protein [Hymenobacter sp. YIM 151500-1]